MPITLYFDTATTGQWAYREPSDAPGQPRMCRLAYVLAEDSGEELDFYSALVQPEPDWPPFQETATVSTGINLAMCADFGTPLREVIARFNGAMLQASQTCSYNTEFHWRVVRNEYRRMHDGADMPMPAEVTDLCAMRYCTDVVRKPRMKPGGGYQWPNQREAYQHFAGIALPPPTEHDPITRGLLMARATRLIAEGSRKAKRTT
jgi:hypothetical protein